MQVSEGLFTEFKPASNANVVDGTTKREISNPGPYDEYWTGSSIQRCPPNPSDKYTIGSPGNANPSQLNTPAQHTSCVKSNTNSFHSSIPVVDMNSFFTDKEQFMKEFEVAIKKGFIAITNFGLDPVMLDQAYSTMERFYQLPLEEKQKFADPKGHGQRGFFVGEKAADAKEADITKEFFGVGQNLSQEDLKKYGIRFQNEWGNPKETGIDLEVPMVALYESLAECVKPILNALSITLGLDEGFLSEELINKKGDTLMRSLHYLPGIEVGTETAAKHTDICMLTILPKATSEGLQIQTSEGEFIDVVVPENAVIVNFGDMLQNLTNGKCPSVVHRVVAKGSNGDDLTSGLPQKSIERYSVVYFIHPPGDFSLNPLQKFIDEAGEQKYPNATAWELLSERLVAINLIRDPKGIAEVAASQIEERLIACGKGNLHVAKQFIEQGVASEEVTRFYYANRESTE